MLNLGRVSLWFSVYFIYLKVHRGQEGELLTRLGANDRGLDLNHRFLNLLAIV
jgi:hypothetical protein